jgi:hypothetical protein
MDQKEKPNRFRAGFEPSGDGLPEKVHFDVDSSINIVRSTRLGGARRKRVQTHKKLTQRLRLG